MSTSPELNHEDPAPGSILYYIAKKIDPCLTEMPPGIPQEAALEGNRAFMADAAIYLESRDRSESLGPVNLTNMEVGVLVFSLALTSAILNAANKDRNGPMSRKFASESATEMICALKASGDYEMFSSPILGASLAAILEHGKGL